MSSVRVRMAPSPTGWIHIGTARTFLFDYLMAKQAENGKLVMRIEDTDVKRSVKGGVDSLYQSLDFLGITADEGPKEGGDFGPYFQTERMEIYKKYAEKMVEEGNAYRCFCTSERLAELKEEQKAMKIRPHYDGLCKSLTQEEIAARMAAGEPFVIRMKVPENETIEYEEPVIGKKISFNSSDTNEQVLLKSDGLPTYHLAVVVDDMLMKITHAVRGSEYIPSIPKQVLLYRYLGAPMPTYLHVPLVLNPDGKGKLSKRKGNVAVIDFIRKGYIKEAIINFVALIGWNPAPEVAHKDEIYDIDFLIKHFDPKRIKKSAGRFEVEKLDSFNAVWIGKLTPAQLYERVMAWADIVLTNNVVDEIRGVTEELTEMRTKVTELKSYLEADRTRAEKLLAIVQQRVKRLTDIYDWFSVLWSTEVGFDMESVDSVLPEVEKRTEIVYNLRDALEKLPDWEQENWEPAIRALADKYSLKHGDLFMVLRVIVTGKKISPPLRDFMELAGREFVSTRFERFLGQ